jgi:hypothetical protein
LPNRKGGGGDPSLSGITKYKDMKIVNRSKKEIQRHYAEERRARKAEYINKNGSSKGWFSSGSYKRSKRNENQTIYRRSVRNREDDINRKLEQVLTKDTPPQNIQVEPIAVDEYYWTALNRRGGQMGSIIEAAEELERANNKFPTIKVKDMNGNTSTYASKIQLELAIQKLYFEANDRIKEAEQEAKKQGKKISQSGRILVTATAINDNGNGYITIEMSDNKTI